MIKQRCSALILLKISIISNDSMDSLISPDFIISKIVDYHLPTNYSPQKIKFQDDIKLSSGQLRMIPGSHSVR
jgi:hypothetical protein